LRRLVPVGTTSIRASRTTSKPGDPFKRSTLFQRLTAGPSHRGRARLDAGRLCTGRLGRPVLQRQRLWGGKKLTALTRNPAGDDFSPPAYAHSLIEIRHAKRIYVSLLRAR